MASLNKVTLIGNVGKDPEIKQLDGGNKLAIITLATSDKYTDRNGNRQEETEWHSVTVFGKLVDVVESFVRKGSMLYVDGRIKTRSWKDDANVTHFRTAIIANNLQLLNRVEPAKKQEESNGDLPNWML